MTEEHSYMYTGCVKEMISSVQKLFTLAKNDEKESGVIYSV